MDDFPVERNYNILDKSGKETRNMKSPKGLS